MAGKVRSGLSLEAVECHTSLVQPAGAALFFSPCSHTYCSICLFFFKSQGTVNETCLSWDESET